MAPRALRDPAPVCEEKLISRDFMTDSLKASYMQWFYILEGSFLFELGGKPFSVAVGDFIHAPSNEPHVFQNTSDKDARMLVIAKPGGLENYFAELAERAMNDPANVAAISEIGARYGIALLGPPIAARR